MKNLMQKMNPLSKNEKGATMVEYAVMVALIAVVAIAMVKGVGQNVNNTFSKVNTELSTATTNTPTK
ncbi:MAG: Flp family type IVb pilin [Methylococcales bacterium]|nr:Flp family type IVb pilin [Methylococcales bacterium]